MLQLDHAAYVPNFRAEVLYKNPPLETLRVSVGLNKTKVILSPRARLTEMPVHPALAGKAPWCSGALPDGAALAAAAEAAAAAMSTTRRRTTLPDYVDPVAREAARMAALRASRAAAAAGEADPSSPVLEPPPRPETVRFTPSASRRFKKRSHNGKYVRGGPRARRRRGRACSS